MLHNHKGQVFSADATIGLSLFVIAVVLSITLLNSHMTDKLEAVREERAVQAAYQAADFLVRTPGFPHNWTADTVQLIGLAEPDHVIQPAKVSALDTLSYTEIRTFLKVRPYELYINITAPSYAYTAGNQWPASAAIVARESRAILVNTTNRTRRGTMEVTVWKQNL